MPTPPSRRAPAPVVLPAAFYARPTLRVARALIGKVLVHDGPGGRAAGLIVETEAYIGEDDPACHASFGRTPRSAPLFEAPGRAYVYLNYGIHCLFNAVTEREGRPAAVLVRALAPLDGIALMHARREGNRRSTGVARALPDHQLCRGPGNLARALGIDLAHNRADLAAGTLRIEDHGHRVRQVTWGPRIGLRVGLDRPWRCWVPGHPAVSGRR
jgi:DNA-3-methyladenine glycosylase